MDHGPEDDYEAATYNRRQALTEPKEPRTYTIPGNEPTANVELLVSLNGEWTLSRDNEYWVLEHHTCGIIPAGPVSWEDLKYAYHGEMRVVDKARIQAAQTRLAALLWGPEDGPPPARVSMMQLLEQDVWWITKDKRVLKVEDMEADHVRNLYGFLLRHAEKFKLRYELRLITGLQPSGDMVCDALDDMTSHLFEQSADQWLCEFPLMKKLAQAVNSDC